MKLGNLINVLSLGFSTGETEADLHAWTSLYTREGNPIIERAFLDAENVPAGFLDQYKKLKGAKVISVHVDTDTEGKAEICIYLDA